MPVDVANVELWGISIGAVAWNPDKNLGIFEYDPKFQKSEIQLSPLKMPLGSALYSFPELDRNTYYGLPGMLADSLPDKYGNLLINEWLHRKGREVKSFSPIERLCYVGTRGMGALEFKPAMRRELGKSKKLEIGSLVELAAQILEKRKTFSTQITSSKEDEASMMDILRVGTSAGGARAKAIIAWNKKTQEIRSGQVEAPEGFEYWLMKFDGVAENRDKEKLADPKGYGKIEWAYHLMARAAGIEMMDCELYQENGCSHFLTKRFDRDHKGNKFHMQSLCALQHYDFNQSGAYSYEQALKTCVDLGLPVADLEQLYRRMIFNVLGRNQDDHTKNIAFLMQKSGEWRLAPAYDVTFSFNPEGQWTHQHQMQINGKRDGFILEDFEAVAKKFKIGTRGRYKEILKDVQNAIKHWPHFAHKAGLEGALTKAIGDTHRSII